MREHMDLFHYYEYLVRLPESNSSMAHLSQRPNVPRLSLRRTLVRQYGSRRALEQLNVANFRAAWALDWGPEGKFNLFGLDLHCVTFGGYFIDAKMIS